MHPARLAAEGTLYHFFPALRASITSFCITVTLLYKCYSSPFQISFLLITYCTSLVANSLGLVSAISGATGITVISYISPGLFYLRLTARQPWHLKKVAACVMLVGGCDFMVLSLTSILIRT